MSKTYKLTPEFVTFSGVKGEPENLSAWFSSIDENYFEDLHFVVSRPQNQISQVEYRFLITLAIVLFSYELDVKELTIDQERAAELVHRLTAAILVEHGRRKGIYKVNGPLAFYNKTTIELTELGKQIAKKLNHDSSSE